MLPPISPVDLWVQLFLPVLPAVLLCAHHVSESMHGSLHTLSYLFLTATCKPGLEVIIHTFFQSPVIGILTASDLSHKDILFLF